MSEDPLEDEQIISNASSPDADFHDDPVQEPAQPVKRKGGRKPVYATVEERKQRNRQAQAAFRERRTEYIKQLESAMKENEDAMEHLQQSNREATEECHMLRYKTSLLEDLLYENGIDFQSELQSRSTKSLLGSPYAPHGPGRPQWPQQVAPEAQRQRPQQSLQKLKPKAKSSNTQSVGRQRPQSLDILPNPTHRMGALPSPHDSMAMSMSMGQSGFGHSNGAVNSMHSSLHRQRLQFEDMQVDPSISPNGHAAPYFSPDAHQMANFLGNTDQERYPDANAYRAQQERRTRPHSSHNRPAPPFSMQPNANGQQRRRAPSNQSLFRQNSFAQGQQMDAEVMELSGRNALPEELPYGDDEMA